LINVTGYIKDNKTFISWSTVPAKICNNCTSNTHFYTLPVYYTSQQILKMSLLVAECTTGLKVWIFFYKYTICLQ